MTVGEYIRTKREVAGVTIAEVARACDVTTQAVYHWENITGGRKPSARKLYALAQVIDLKPSEVVELVKLAAS